MILSKNYQDINSVYDFYEGIISSISLDNNFVDLLVTVYYSFDDPQGLKDKDLVLRFKNCTAISFDCANMLVSVKEFDIVSPHPEIQSISLKRDDSYIDVEISTNFSSPMLSLSCEGIWIESSE